MPELRCEVIGPNCTLATVSLCVLGAYSLVLWITALAQISLCTPLLAAIPPAP